MTSDERTRLTAWLRVHAGWEGDDCTLSLITGGRSNLTYELRNDNGMRMVLRMPPKGDGEGRGRALEREFSTLRAVADSNLPVPDAIALCTDPSVVGAPFYVSSFVDGFVAASPEDGAKLAPEGRAAASRDVVDRLAELHGLDPAKLGLAGLGPGKGYLGRQLDRWVERVRAADPVNAPAIAETQRLLAAAVPEESGTSLIHGDYKFANVMLDPTTGAVRAILDWELATVGDPLSDLANLLVMWPDPGEDTRIESPTSTSGFLTRADVVERYAEASGRDLTHLGWYQAFAEWKLACLLVGVVHRYRSGAMETDGFDIDASTRLVGELAHSARGHL
ncbi:phosphotransferase family protein (plasmid) [Rhodococcus sp. USK10]|uniref:phosphotransferase family protein n=1 Tax=Rhodococcus sp. USK10 TaxID=2789739 RepID=UPI001C5D1546|nr:phosphotransferase family protein [Rhodococcus sp. USK10]QYB00269.1 phosphotransferase family protein [Rhodococcus sp. USK10]